jgi:hypothetical protein
MAPEKGTEMATKNRDEIIPVDKVEQSPRGRRIDINSDLIDTFKSVKKWQAVSLKGTFGAVPHEDRNRVSHAIRRHWELARSDRPRIDFSPEGIPQVRVKETRKKV